MNFIKEFIKFVKSLKWNIIPESNKDIEKKLEKLTTDQLIVKLLINDVKCQKAQYIKEDLEKDLQILAQQVYRIITLEELNKIERLIESLNSETVLIDKILLRKIKKELK